MKQLPHDYNLLQTVDLWINRLMVILLNINITYSNVIPWYDMVWDMIYHMIYDSDMIWYQIIFDIWYGSGGFRGGMGSAPPLGQYIHLNKNKMGTPNIFEQSRTPLAKSSICQCILRYVFMSYLNIPSSSNNYDNVTTSLICLHSLHFMLLCVSIVFSMLTNICNT